MDKLISNRDRAKKRKRVAIYGITAGVVLIGFGILNTSYFFSGIGLVSILFHLVSVRSKD